MAGNISIQKLMKMLFTVLLSMAVFLPLYAQETADDAAGQAQGEYYDPYYHPNYQAYYEQGDKPSPQTGDKPDNIAAAEDEPAEELTPDKPKETGFARRHIEIGIDAGIGYDNDLFRQRDIFQKDLVIDLEKIGGDVGPDGLNLNLDVLAGFFINIKNITIKNGIWGFGFSLNVDGGINFNVPKSLFTLLSEGNINHRSVKGTISASGGIFADAGPGVSAKYGKLSLGVRPALFAPLIFIPKSGINYQLETSSYISLETSGDIQIYSIVNEDRKIIRPSFGADLSLEGEYALFEFLDVGGSLSNIPLVPAAMEDRMIITLKDDFGFVIQDPLNTEMDFPDDFEFETTHDVAPIKVFRPLRFDVYARWKPLGEFLAVKPNAGFSVSIVDKELFFNAGAEARINLLKNLLSLHAGTGRKELVWKHRLGFALNFRGFELDLEAMLRSQNFARSFGLQGLGVNLGLRFGW